jgi:transposase
LNARIAELEAKLGRPPKTPDNSSLPPSRGQKANTEPLAMKPQRKGRPGVARKLAEKPDARRRFYAERCACGTALGEAGQDLAKEYDPIDIPPIRPVTTRIELFRATCPCCKARVTANAPTDMPEGTPFGPGITSVIAYLHGLPDGQLQAADRSLPGPVRPHHLAGRHRQHARPRRQDNRSAGRSDRDRSAPERGDRQRRDECAREGQDLVAVDVRLPAQCGLAQEHQFCLAHLIRDAQYAIDHGDTIFALDFKTLLKDACAVGRRHWLACVQRGGVACGE